MFIYKKKELPLPKKFQAVDYTMTNMKLWNSSIQSLSRYSTDSNVMCSS